MEKKTNKKTRKKITKPRVKMPLDHKDKKSKVDCSGRETVFKYEYCNMLMDHMSDGLSFESFGGVARVSKQTIYNWLEKYPEFARAKEEGSMLSLLEWEKLGLSGVKGKIQGFQAHTYALNMYNRFSWTRKVEQKVDADVKSQSIEDYLRTLKK